jgi:hypothetical protein
MLHNHCRNCTERVVGCHSTCDKYKKFKEELEVVREEKCKESILRDIRYRGMFAQARKTGFYYSKGMKWKL